MGLPMTSSLRHNRAPRGFTLIEMLVVMGIILLIISILLPTLNRASREASRARIAADFQVISQALDAYKADFGDYPRPGLLPNGNPVGGAQILCWALIGPGDAGDGFGNPLGTDGQAGPGFRVRGTQGTVYGPYLALDRFKYGILDNNGNIQTNSATDDTQNVIADRYNHPILYFVANKAAVDSSPNGYTGTWNYNTGVTHPHWNFMDNQGFLNNGNLITNSSTPMDPPATTRFDWMLGDINADGTINNGEIPVTTPYILWSAGPDGKFLPTVADSSSAQNAVNACDDVTNFR